MNTTLDNQHMSAIDDEPLTIITDDIPDVQRDNIASAVLDGALAYFESAENRAKYELWLAARKASA